MRIAFLSTRINGLDGVTLEIHKWASILSELGHTIFYCAGELEELPNKTLIPEMHFQHPAIASIDAKAFGQRELSDGLLEEIEACVELLYKSLKEFIRKNGIDEIIAENILTIPMNIPLGIALARLIRKEEVRTIAHHHDFYWERERFLTNCLPEILEAYFPPQDKCITHVVINSLAQKNLLVRTGLKAEIIPNIFDFDRETRVDTHIVTKVREALHISPQEIMVLQPTRIIPRKGIELAIDLVAELRKSPIVEKLSGRKAKLVLSHPSGDEGDAYLKLLVEKAAALGVPLIQAQGFFSGNASRFCLWDAYQAADLVTYPSFIEGFGNALLEAIYFRKVTVINRYPVYATDISPLGFDLLEMDGRVTGAVTDRVVATLNDHEKAQQMTDRNFDLGKRYYSYTAIKPKLDKIIGILLSAGRVN
ncbi:MAG: glycosyltransferase family 4 protein [Chloroflexi bacterium]|nr:glycosyltransferase family 4 protein [Chloroflexota bacterium]